MFNKQQSNTTTVMAFGTFDILHAGHEHFLKKAKSFGDQLIVVVARDRTVKKIKGENPLNNEKKRAKAIREKGLADKVILGHFDDKYKNIRKHRPDTIVLGYDQMVFTQKLNKLLIDNNLNTTIERLEAFYPQVYKSSLLKQENCQE